MTYLLIIFAATMVFFLAVYFLGATRREEFGKLISFLNGGSLVKTIWFEQNDAITLLYEDATYGTRSLSKSWEIAKNNKLIGGYAPLFTLILPLEKSPGSWFVAVKNDSSMESALSRLFPSPEINIGNRTFRIHGEPSDFQKRIEGAMPKIDDLLGQMMGENTECMRISCGPTAKFYKWRLHYGYFVEIPLPEEIHKNPAKIKSIAGHAIEILEHLNLHAKRFK